MIQRTVDDKGQVVRKALAGDEVFGIGDDGLMGNHHSFRFACGARGVENVGDALGTIEH